MAVMKVRADQLRPGDFLEMDGLMKVESIQYGDGITIIAFSGDNVTTVPNDYEFTIQRQT